MFRLSKNDIWSDRTISTRQVYVRGFFVLLFWIGGRDPACFFLFVCHTGFSVMRHGSRQRLSLGQQVLCSRELIRLQLASRHSACLCTPVPVWDGGGKALMDQNIDTRILFKCIHGLTLSLRRKEKNLFCNKSLRWWTKTLTQEFLSACYFNPLSLRKTKHGFFLTNAHQGLYHHASNTL